MNIWLNERDFALLRILLLMQALGYRWEQDCTK